MPRATPPPRPPGAARAPRASRATTTAQGSQTIQPAIGSPAIAQPNRAAAAREPHRVRTDWRHGRRFVRGIDEQQRGQHQQHRAQMDRGAQRDRREGEVPAPQGRRQPDHQKREGRRGRRRPSAVRARGERARRRHEQRVDQRGELVEERQHGPGPRHRRHVPERLARPEIVRGQHPAPQVPVAAQQILRFEHDAGVVGRSDEPIGHLEVRRVERGNARRAEGPPAPAATHGRGGSAASCRAEARRLRRALRRQSPAADAAVTRAASGMWSAGC